jgi:peptide/nickel transport system permease protein
MPNQSTTVPPTPARADGGAAKRPPRPRLPTAVRRTVHLVAVCVLVTLLASSLVDLIPGSPGAAILGPNATPEQLAALDAEYGFDRPFLTRYLEWLGHAFSGDLGSSIQNGQPVLDTILRRFPVTLELTLLALVISLLVAVPLAVASASRAGGVLDRVTTTLASALMAVPVFVAAVVLIYLLAVRSRAFPVSGWSPLSAGLGTNLRFAALPALALAVGELPAFLRLLRADMVTNLREDFVLVATVRGLPRWYVLLRHVLRPSSFSLLTMVGVAFGRLLAGSVVVESLFALPGLGSLAIQSIPAKDIPTIQGLVTLVALAYVLVNMAVDAGYLLLDPRLRSR